jgi:uncharacterized protein
MSAPSSARVPSPETPTHSACRNAGSPPSSRQPRLPNVTLTQQWSTRDPWSWRRVERRPPRGRRAILALLLASLAAGCSAEPADDEGAYERVMAFDTARVRLAGQRATAHLTLELAVTPEQKSMGLMERRRLADDAGMLFVYDSTQPADAGFWMYRTRIPLDIAFIDSAGVIRVVRSMTPCAATIAQGCPTYTPDVPYRFALEMNAGFFARRGIGAGDSLFLQDVPPSNASEAPPTRP